MREVLVLKVFKAVWAHLASEFSEGPKAVKGFVEKLKDGGFDLILPLVKGTDGLFSYPTSMGTMNPALEGWDPLGALIDEAHSQGLKVHPWFCVFPEGKHSLLLKEKPELAARDKDGNSLPWGCPAKDEVQDFEFSLYEEVMKGYPVDGVHMDYIRYSGGGMCFCETCREAFKSKKDVDPVELERKDPAWADWVRWRVGNISKFVERLSKAARGRGLEVSAAVFTDYPMALVWVGQDWVGWAEKGYVDYLFPMTYTNLTELARALTKTHIALVGDAVPVWEGLGKSSSASTLSTEMLMEQVEAVMEAGAKGIVIFHSKALEKEDLKALKRLDMP
ncbi:MAG: hypothetical protein AYL32_011610 [Candidatus Bathyarchaeota archaeon B26-2]|nr:MAG: hypothetical protein AYL32_011610 [Candidatus Bathyarchaeota archaeon B26-2]